MTGDSLGRLRSALAGRRQFDSTVAGACVHALAKIDGVAGACLTEASAADAPLASVGRTAGEAAVTEVIRVADHDLRLRVHADASGDPTLLRMAAVAAAAILDGHLRVVEGRRAQDRDRELAETLACASRTLSSALTLREVFASLLDQLGRVVPFDSASVQILRADKLEIIGGMGFENLDELIGLRFDLAGRHHPNRSVIETGTTSIMADVSEHFPVFRRGVHRPASIRGWMGVPLVFGGETLGMLSIDSRVRGFYTEDHARVAQVFAAQAAIAMQNAELFERLSHTAATDELTGVANRRHVQEVGRRAVADARQTGAPLGVLLFDVDHFKDVNDTYGHATGDQVLRHITAVAAAVLRDGDCMGRFGGEEFLAVLPQADLAATRRIGERVRSAIAEAPAETDDGPVTVTVSVGCAAGTPDARGLDGMLRDADTALYAAKADGRDRVAAT